MGARAWIVILCIGVGSILSFGILTKFAIDSNPDLQAMIRFKAAFARDFDGKGVEDVALKKAPRRRGYQMVLTVPKTSAFANPTAIDGEIAEYFLENFEAKAGPALAIRYETAGDLGCEGPVKIREFEVPVAPLKARIVDRTAAGRLAENLYVEHGCVLASWSREGQELVVEIEAAPDSGPDLADLARELEPAVRQELRVLPYTSLRLRVRWPLGGFDGAPGEASDPIEPSPAELEVRFDASGRETTPRAPARN